MPPEPVRKNTALANSHHIACAPTLSSQQAYDGLAPAQHCTRRGPTSEEQRGLIVSLDLRKALPNEIP